MGKTVEEHYLATREIMVKTIMYAVKDDRLKRDLRTDIATLAFELFEKNVYVKLLIGIAKSIIEAEPDMGDFLYSIIALGEENANELSTGREKILNLLKLAQEQAEAHNERAQAQ
jgi:hypothetical protein